MTFHEKSSLMLAGVLALVFGWYFVLVVGVADSPGREYAYTALTFVAAALVTILATVSHVVLALIYRSEANAHDERDRLVALRSERIAGWVLAVGVFTGIGLSMARVDRFWIAQALIASLVVAQITDSVIKVVLYRRGT